MKKQAGFTLFELLTSLAIFALLAGGIFTVVGSGVRASTNATTEEFDRARWEALRSYLQGIWANLPSDATVEIRSRQVGERGTTREVVIGPALTLANLVDGRGDSDTVTICALPNGDGSYRLVTEAFSADYSDKERSTKGHLVELIPDIRGLKWRFKFPNDPAWNDSWERKDGRPGIVEMRLRDPQDAEIVMQFTVPPAYGMPTSISSTR